MMRAGMEVKMMGEMGKEREENPWRHILGAGDCLRLGL